MTKYGRHNQHRPRWQELWTTPELLPCDGRLDPIVNTPDSQNNNASQFISQLHLLHKLTACDIYHALVQTALPNISTHVFPAYKMALFDLVTATVGLVFLSSLVTADATAIRNYVDTIKKMIEDSTRQGSGDDVFGLSNYASFGIALVPMLVAAMFMFFRVAKPFVRAKENRAERK